MKKMGVFINKIVCTAIFLSIFVSQTFGKPEERSDGKVNVGEAPADFYNIDLLKNVSFSERQDAIKATFHFEAPPDNAYAYSRRRGSATEDHACDTITAVPRHLTFITRYRHYRKYTHAYGIPVISTSVVRDSALKRACYVLRFLLADRRVLRKYLYTYFGRIGVIGSREGVISIPEHRHLGAWWNGRARGLGGTLAIPISTGGEENLLCWPNDRYRVEDIFLHEFSHGIQEIAIKGGGIPGFMRRLTAAYNSARYSGRWARTYAMSSVQEYFGEGTQCFFDCNAESIPPNGIHNHVNTRAELRSYDPTLYRLVREVFPCMNRYHNRCTKGTPGGFRMNCDGDGRVKPKPKPKTNPPPKPPTDPPTNPPPEPPTDPPATQPPPPTQKPTPKTSGCREDKNRKCASWASHRFCDDPRYNHYMIKNCQKSCCCTDKRNNCEQLASKDHCKFNKGYMHRFCRKSCGVYYFSKGGTPGLFRLNCESGGITRPKPKTPKPTKPPPPPTPPKPKPKPTTQGPPPPPTTMKPTPKTTGCLEDKNNKCGGWTTRGYCDNRLYKAYMKANCENSCCCTDQGKRCASRVAQEGACDAHKGFMRRFCRKSCGVCMSW